MPRYHPLSILQDWADNEQATSLVARSCPGTRPLMAPAPASPCYPGEARMITLGGCCFPVTDWRLDELFPHERPGHGQQYTIQPVWMRPPYLPGSGQAEPPRSVPCPVVGGPSVSAVALAHALPQLIRTGQPWRDPASGAVLQVVSVDGTRRLVVALPRGASPAGMPDRVAGMPVDYRVAPMP